MAIANSLNTGATITFTGANDFTGTLLGSTGVTFPVTGTLATTAYVDSVASGISLKAAVTAATTVDLNATYANGAAGVGATLTNAGALATFSVDSITLALNDRVLVKNQINAENGLYVCIYPWRWRDSLDIKPFY